MENGDQIKTTVKAVGIISNHRGKLLLVSTNCQAGNHHMWQLPSEYVGVQELPTEVIIKIVKRQLDLTVEPPDLIHAHSAYNLTVAREREISFFFQYKIPRMLSNYEAPSGRQSLWCWPKQLSKGNVHPDTPRYIRDWLSKKMLTEFI
jgi:ADP-ribose pyrophosphatase YjhB (NUDIX family)